MVFALYTSRLTILIEVNCQSHNMIYHYICNCGEDYIGETVGMIKSRFSQHWKTNGLTKGELKDHRKICQEQAKFEILETVINCPCLFQMADGRVAAEDGTPLVPQATGRDQETVEDRALMIIKTIREPLEFSAQLELKLEMEDGGVKVDVKTRIEMEQANLFRQLKKKLTEQGHQEKTPRDVVKFLFPVISST